MLAKIEKSIRLRSDRDVTAQNHKVIRESADFGFVDPIYEQLAWHEKKRKALRRKR